MATKYYDFHLSYFKQGDDLSAARNAVIAAPENSSLTTRELDSKAMLLHAEILETAAAQLKYMAGLIIEHGIQIENTGTHHIGLSMDDSLGNRLCAEDIVTYYDEDTDDQYAGEDDDNLVEDSDEICELGTCEGCDKERADMLKDGAS